MGIRGFYSYIQEFADAALVWHKLQNCQLVIDGNNLAHEIYSNSPGMNVAFGGDYDKYAMHIEQFFKKLSECKVEPVVVMDGGYPMQRNKFKTAYSRLTDQMETCSIINPDNQDSLRVFPIMARSVFIFTIHKMGVKVLQADFEADDEIVVVAKKLGAYVLSNDSDFYIFDVPFILLHSVNMKHIQKEETSKDGCISKFIPCYRFDVDKFCKVTGVRKELMPLLAPILGNDYVNPRCMIDFYTSIFSLRPTSKKISGRKKIIISVIKWLSTQKGSPEEILEKIINFGWTKRLFSSRLQNGLKKAFQMYFPSSSYLEPWVCDHEQSCFIKSGNEKISRKKNLEQHFFKSSSVVKKLLCTCENRTNFTILSYGELPGWFIRSYRLGLVPHIVADFFTKDYFFTIPQIEAYDKECIYITFVNLIKDMRGLLWVTYARGGENLNLETDENSLNHNLNIQKKKTKKRTLKETRNYVKQNTNTIEETDVGVFSGKLKENENDDKKVDKNEDETSLSVKEPAYTTAALPCDNSFNNENNKNLDTGLEGNFCKSLTIEDASVIDDDDDDAKLACEEINDVEDRSSDLDSKSKGHKETEFIKQNEASTKFKEGDPIASLNMNYYNPSKSIFSSFEFCEPKLFTSISSKSENECVQKSKNKVTSLPCENSFNDDYLCASSQKNHNLEMVLSENLCKSLTIENESVNDNDEITVCKGINNLGIHCSSDLEFKSECSMNAELTKIEEPSKRSEDPIARLNMNYYDASNGNFWPGKVDERKLSNERTKSPGEVETKSDLSINCRNRDSVQKLGLVEDDGNIDIQNDEAFNYNKCNDICSDISDTSNDSCVKEIEEDEEYEVNNNSEDENDETSDEHELESGNIKHLNPWEIKYIPPMRMFYRGKNTFKVHKFPQEEIGCYNTLPSLFDIEMYSEKKKLDLFYSFINFKRKIYPSRGIEFIILCICFWIKRYGHRTNLNNIFSVLVCVVMFYVIDGKIGRIRSKRSPEEVSSFIRKINNIKQSGKFGNLSSMSVDELIGNLTKEECKLAAFYMDKFHSMDPKVNKKNYDRYIMHSFSEFQATVYFLQYLNSLLYFPFPVIGMDSIWSGTFCYNVLNSLNHVNNINVLLGMIFASNDRMKMLYVRLYSQIRKLAKIPAVESTFFDEPTIVHEVKILQKKLGIKNISANKKKKKIKRNVISSLEEKIEYSNEELPLLAENRFSALVIV